MSGRDILFLLLVVYGFSDIEISTYRGVGNTIGYKIHAVNKTHNIGYNEENCEGIMFNIAYLINHMQEYGVSATYDTADYSLKDIVKLIHNGNE